MILKVGFYSGMIEDVVAILSILLTFLSGVLIVAFNKSKAIPGFLLATIFIIFSLYSFIYFVKGNTSIFYFHYLLQICKSLYLALAPLCYLYFKYVIFRKQKISKQDYLHFIPSLIVLLDIVYHYFFKGVAENHVKEGYKVVYDFIPKSAYITFKTIQGLVYIVLIWIIDFLPVWKQTMKNNLNSVKRSWLYIFKVTITLLYVFATNSSYHFIIDFFNLGPLSFANPTMASQILLLMMVVLMFFYPSVIYRSVSTASQCMELKAGFSVDKAVENQPQQALSRERLAAYIQQIEALNNDTRFFKSVMTIADLADFLKISPRHLTYILNHHYQMRFTDFINGHRIRYIIRQFGTGFLKDLTMEAIAFEAGFASRSTFFAAFKKYTGKNPSQYLKAQLLQEN